MPSRTHRKSEAHEIRSVLFMVRVWLEDVDKGRSEWRGKAQRVVSGETLYFRDWESLLEFLRGASNEQLPEAVSHDEPAEPDRLEGEG